MANSVDPDQTAPIGAVCSGSTLFASIPNLSGMLGNYLLQTTSADDIFRCIFFLGALRVKIYFFISLLKHMLWELKRTVSMRQFFCSHKRWISLKYSQFYTQTFCLSRLMN